MDYKLSRPLYIRWRGSLGDKRDWVGVELEDIIPGGGTGQLQVYI